MSYRAHLMASWLSLAGLTSASASTYTQIFSFPGNNEGGPVGGPVVDSSGALYVATDGPGVSGNTGAGAVFKLSPPSPGQTGWTGTPLYMFGHGTDAQFPSSRLLFDAAGALYGVAAFGGNFGNGAVYKLTPPTAGKAQWTESVIYSFTGGADGKQPHGGLVFDQAGALYGAAGEGGTFGLGTVFKLTPPALGQTGWTVAVVHTFGKGSDGADPIGDLVFGKDGALYGTTGAGGNFTASICQNYGCGTVFKLSPPASGKTAWTEQILCKFAGADGLAFPDAGVIFDSAGALYGTTSDGNNSNDGAVFKLAPPTTAHADWQLQTLYRFRYRLGGAHISDGAQPGGGVVFDPSGALYGSTSRGGSAGDGTIYQLSPPTPSHPAWSEKTLFQPPSNDSFVNPKYFVGSLLRNPKTGALYGVSQNGGAGNSGTVFAIKP